MLAASHMPEPLATLLHFLSCRVLSIFVEPQSLLPLISDVPLNTKKAMPLDIWAVGDLNWPPRGLRGLSSVRHHGYPLVCLLSSLCERDDALILLDGLLHPTAHLKLQ